MMWFAAGFICAVILLGSTVPSPNDVCASAFGMKPEEVRYHDGMCWKRNSDTPLAPTTEN